MFSISSMGEGGSKCEGAGAGAGEAGGMERPGSRVCQCDDRDMDVRNECEINT
jgi:hypothetical protein